MSSNSIAEEGRPHVGWPVMLAYWLAQFAAWLAILTPVVMTLAIRVGEVANASEKARWLGLITGIGAVAAVAASPIWGRISDRSNFRVGKRKFWIIVGSLSLLIGLVIMAYAPNPWWLLCGWLVCQVGSNAGQAALMAVMSDVIPEEQHGIMSALLGVAPTAAIMVGVFITQFTSGNHVAMFLVPWVLSPIAVVIFVAVVPEGIASTRHQDRPNMAVSTQSPDLKSYVDFTWAFVSRFLVLCSYAFPLTYQVYFMTDHLHIPQNEIGYYMTITTSLGGTLSLVVSFLGGWLSDRFLRRKPFVIVAALALAIGSLGLAFADSFEQMLLSMIAISVGQGLYYAVDMALCVEVLPGRDNAARDLGILNAASTLPQSFAPAVAPLVLAIATGISVGSNYPLLFMVGFAMALAGALAILPIRRVR